MQITDCSKCTGCALCLSQCKHDALTMEAQKDGFFYPVVDASKCVSCGICAEICPQNKMEEGSFSLWKDGYAAWAVQDDIREQSSSGGIATVLSQQIIRNGGSVMGAVMDDQFSLRHIVATEEADCIRMQKTKYMQSDTRKIYEQAEEILSSGNEVLFIGCPCQVDAISRHVSRKRLSERFFSCELLCHAVPSPILFQKYILALERIAKSRIVSYDFRSKKNSWEHASVTIVYENGKEQTVLHRENHFHKWFGQYFSIRECCFQCAYRRAERCADLTIGDFWKIQEVLPQVDPKDGISRVFVNTEKGRSLLARCNDSLRLLPVDIEATVAKTRRILINPTVPEGRKAFLQDMETRSMEWLMKRYAPSKNMKRRIRTVIKRVLQNK